MHGVMRVLALRRSIESVQSIMISDKHCYELYGFDIMFDRQAS